MKHKLKLYVWEDVLCDYTSGVMFALAESVEDARQQILKKGKKIALLTFGKVVDYETIERDLKQEPKVYKNKMGFFLFGGA